MHVDNSQTRFHTHTHTRVQHNDTGWSRWARTWSRCMHTDVPSAPGGHPEFVFNAAVAAKRCDFNEIVVIACLGNGKMVIV